MTKRQLVLTALGGVVVAALGVSVVLAQDGSLGGKLRTGSDISIPTGETVDSDLYAFGGTVSVAGAVNGDVVASGGRVVISGPVSGDVLAAGGTVEVSGTVEGDVRLAGGTVLISGELGEDALVAGGTVDVAGQVGEDLIVSGGQVTVSGTVAGSATGGAGTYNRTGTIGGADEIAVRPVGQPEPRPMDTVIAAVQQILAVLFFGLLAIWLAPRTVEASERTIRERPLTALGWGIVAFVGFIVLVAVIAIIAVVVAVGLGAVGLNVLAGLDVAAAVIGISALCLIFAVVVAFLVDALVGIALGKLIWRRGPPSMNGGSDRSRLVTILVLGAVIVVILTWIPIVGGLIKLAVVLLGLGALAVVMRPQRPSPPVARAAEVPA